MPKLDLSKEDREDILAWIPQIWERDVHRYGRWRLRKVITHTQCDLCDTWGPCFQYSIQDLDSLHNPYPVDVCVDRDACRLKRAVRSPS